MTENEWSAKKKRGTWQAVQRGDDPDTVDATLDDDAERDFKFYLTNNKARELCNSIMTAAERRDAHNIGLPLPLSEIRTPAASAKYHRMISNYGASPDFECMASDWNNEVYVGIAAAVRSGTAKLNVTYFIDKYKLRHYATELKKRAASNRQFDEHKETFVAFNTQLAKSNKEQHAKLSKPPSEPSAAEHGAQPKQAPAPLICVPVPALVAPAPTPAKVKVPRRCTVCGGLMKGHKRGKCSNSNGSVTPTP
jgi:hypothetical protein